MMFKKVLQQSSESFFSKDKKKKKEKKGYKLVVWGFRLKQYNFQVSQSYLGHELINQMVLLIHQLQQIAQAAQSRRLASTRSMHPPSKGIPICHPPSGPPVAFMGPPVSVPKPGACHMSLGQDGCAWESTGHTEPPHPSDPSTELWLVPRLRRPPPTPQLRELPVISTR